MAYNEDDDILVMSGYNWMYWSDDRGVTWNSVNVPESGTNHYYYSPIYYPKTKEFIAVTWAGSKVIKSSDNGKTWVFESIDSENCNFQFGCIDFGNVYYVSPNKSRLAVYNGKTWTKITVPRSYRSIAYSEEQNTAVIS